MVSPSSSSVPVLSNSMVMQKLFWVGSFFVPGYAVP